MHHLVADQFPQWKNLSIRPVAASGWDNNTFHLGSHMLVRLPSAAIYAMQVEKEHQWLPKLAPLLPLQIPIPLEVGKPAKGYPWQWSIYKWLEGDTAASVLTTDLNDFAIRLAQFLFALHRIDVTDGPIAGPHSFHRGGALSHYDIETRKAIADLKSNIDTDAATAIWEAALATQWENPPVWVHGDISAGNLLMKEGQLSGIIDFGQLAIGDPACDLAIAWTLFKAENRETFRKTLSVDDNTWKRGRAWALWKALIVAAGLTDTNTVERAHCWRIIEEILSSQNRFKD